MATPKTTRDILDGNLTRAVPAGVFNRRVLILGTALDGPMYDPVRVTSPDDASSKFGAFGTGTLVRGIKECFDAQNGFPKTPDVWGMRIGGVKAARAKGSLQDSSSNELLVLEALNEGSKYNDVTVKFDSGKINIYNPNTGLNSSYSYDFTDWNSVSAQIHTMDELAAAINSDPNLNGIISASVPDYTASSELSLVASEVVSASAGETVIDLSTIDVADAAYTTLLLNGLTNDGATVADNPIREIESAWSINTSAVTEIPKGEKSIKVEGGLAQGSTSIFPLCNMSSTGGYETDAASSEAYWKVRGAQCVFLDSSDNVIGDEITELEDSGTTFTIQVEVDANHAGPSGATAGLGVTKWDNSGDISTSGTNYVKLDFVNMNSGETSQILWNGDGSSGNTTSTYTAGKLKFVVNTSDIFGTTAQVGPIKAYASFDTGIVTLNKKSLLSSTSLSTDYFVRGNEVVFGVHQPHTLAFRYGRVQFYDVGTSLVINNAQTGRFTLSGPYQPGIAGAALSNAAAMIGLTFKYYKGNPGTTTVTMTGGLNGVDLSNADLYDDLDSAYENINQDFFDIFTVMSATFDATKTGYHSTTGVPSVMNAGFADQMSKFLNSFNGELIGVMGFESLDGTGVGGRILKTDISERVKYITAPAAISDPLRPANLLSDFHQPWMYGVDMEAIFNYRGNRYGANASAAVCGMLAGIPTEEAIYRFNVPGVQGMVWRYDDIDQASGSQQVDVLSDNRIAVGVVDGNTVKLSDGRSLAKAGSDFENIMTVLILQEVLEICRATAKDFIGKVSSAQLLQAFQSQLNRNIGEQMVPRVLRGFKAPVEMTAGERVVGKLTIPLTLSPQFELRDVHYVVQLTAEEITAA